MKKILVIIIGISLVLTNIFYMPKVRTAQAVDCTPVDGATFTISADCNFSGGVNGIDHVNGSANDSVLTINSGKTLTVNSNQTLAFGSIVLNGSIITSSGSSIRLGMPLWMDDADNDGYPKANPTTYAQNSQPASTRRRASMSSLTSTDCNDSNVSAWRYRYADADNDTYGTSSSSCVGNDSGYVDDNTDCYDLNPSAKPGQTNYYTTNRGDGSFDFDCDSAVTNYATGKGISNNVCGCTTLGGVASWTTNCGTSPTPNPYPGYRWFSMGYCWQSSVPTCGTNGNWCNQGANSGSQCVYNSGACCTAGYSSLQNRCK